MLATQFVKVASWMHNYLFFKHFNYSLLISITDHNLLNLQFVFDIRSLEFLLKLKIDPKIMD